MKEIPGTTFLKWAAFLNIVGMGRKPKPVREAKILHHAARRALFYIERDIPMYRNLELLRFRIEREQLKELLAAIATFLNSPMVAPLPSEDAAELKSLVLDVEDDRDMRIGFGQTVTTLIHSAEKTLERGGWKQSAEKELWLAYTEIKAMQAKFELKYATRESVLKRLLPPHFSPLISQFLELFIYGPIRMLIQYLHLNHPGPLGVFNGLDEEE